MPIGPCARWAARLELYLSGYRFSIWAAGEFLWCLFLSVNLDFSSPGFAPLRTYGISALGDPRVPTGA